MKLYWMIFWTIVVSGCVKAEPTDCTFDNGVLLKEVSIDLDNDGEKETLKLIRSEKNCVIKNAFSPWYGNYHVDKFTLDNTSVIIISKKGLKQIIVDTENPSILDTTAAENITALSHSDAIELFDELRKSSGDVLTIPTESGIDSYLYWSGNKYQVLFPTEEP